MNKFEIKAIFKQYNSASDLESIEKTLCESAKEALKNAYAPYSNFKVGASVMLQNGTIIKGNNQENAAYPSGLCAERVAVYSASANFPNEKIISIAISSKSSNIKKNNTPVAPCGACRQALLEYEIKQKSPIKVLLVSENNTVIESESIANLLPLSFTLNDL
ncbi:MAG: cytidine deaminase [Bacteroidetes bacterium]|nr:cytidine deaminase [Bacteroidota bacterium]